MSEHTKAKIIKDKTKTAVCDRQVPAVLNDGHQTIEVGDRIQYTKVVLRNGEHHIISTNGKSIPAIFFDL